MGTGVSWLAGPSYNGRPMLLPRKGRLAMAQECYQAEQVCARSVRTPKAWEYRMQNISHVLA